MAILHPSKADFLNNIVERTIDLMDIFKDGYVDIGFEGSTSIKKVLPIIIPNLSYDGMKVSDGTDAMVEFINMIEMPNGDKKGKLRNEMLAYCKLDTLAMVEIFKKIKNLY